MYSGHLRQSADGAITMYSRVAQHAGRLSQVRCHQRNLSRLNSGARSCVTNQGVIKGSGRCNRTLNSSTVRPRMPWPQYRTNQLVELSSLSFDGEVHSKNKLSKERQIDKRCQLSQHRIGTNQRRQLPQPCIEQSNFLR